MRRKPFVRNWTLARVTPHPNHATVPLPVPHLPGRRGSMTPPPPGPAHRRVAILRHVLAPLLAATGAAGLADEVVLGRLLQLHLGSSGASQAVTLAAFLGGLALGTLAAGRWAQRLLHATAALRAYAALEAGVGLWAILLPDLADGLFGALGPWLAVGDPTSLTTTAVKLAGAALLVVPLAAGMGATLPVLAVGMTRALPGEAVALISRCYAWNAAGAAAGALVAGLVLIEEFGLELPLVLAGIGNLGVAAVVWGLARHMAAPNPLSKPDAAPPSSDVAGTTDAAVTGRARTPLPASLLGAAAATGATALLSEILWTRAEALWLGASVYAFGLMLAVVILGIALGSGGAIRLLRSGRDASALFSLSQCAAAAGNLWVLERLDATAIELASLRTRLVATPENYAWWLALGGGWSALQLLVPAIALGAAFPLLLYAAHRRGVDADRATAYLLASHTTGNLVGALGGGFLLLPWLGLEGCLLAAVTLSLTLGILHLPRPWSMARALPAGAVGLAVASWFAVAPAPLDADVLRQGLFRLRARGPEAVHADVARLRAERTLYRHDGKDASVTVVQLPGGDRVFRVNGKTDGSTGDAPTQVVLGLVGFLVHPTARDVLVVGLGTGQSAAAAAAVADTRVDVAELSEGVVAGARHFARANDHVLDRASVRIVVSDAREVLRARADASLDLVVSEPSNPWVVGVADLYTHEHFARVRQKLRPAGVLVQWIHAYEISDATLAAILCTLQGQLPHVAVFRMAPGDLALVASAAPLALDVRAAQALLRQPGVQRLLAARGRPDLPDTLDTWLITQLCGSATVATVCRDFALPLSERRPAIEYSAPRAFFAGTRADLLVAALDTRATAAQDVWLGPALRLSPLDGARRARLQAFLTASGQPSERTLLAAVSPADAPPVDVAAVLHSLPDPATLPLQGRAAWCAWLRNEAPWALTRLVTVLGPATPRTAALAWRDACRTR